MLDKSKQPVNLVTVGKDLVAYAHKSKLAEKRGVVIELFPFIYEASARLSSRGISRYLAEKHQVKVSAVTVASALSNLKRSWNQYFDVIAPFAQVFEKGSYFSPMGVFLFDDKRFEKMTEALPLRRYLGHWLDLKALRRITVEDADAANILREKWFSIRLETRLKARPYIEHRLA